MLKDRFSRLNYMLRVRRVLLGREGASGKQRWPSMIRLSRMIRCYCIRFNDKRTPSWTDRVLWRGFADDETYHPHPQQKDHPAGHLQQHANTTFAAVPEVIASDHEPVYCLLGLPREIYPRQNMSNALITQSSTGIVKNERMLMNHCRGARLYWRLLIDRNRGKTDTI